MPSFSIEAEGETNPLTESTLLQALHAASSSNSNQIQAGTKQLQQWERSPGFYRDLQSVFLTRTLATEVRYLAVIQLKNGIDKYWRKTAPNAVNREDKDLIRSRLIPSTLDEPDLRLALQNVLVTAKIVRFEYPSDWPSAISDSLHHIREAVNHDPANRLERSLLSLLHIIKELSTARIQRSRTNLQAATPEILAVLGQLYIVKIEQWQAMLNTPDVNENRNKTIMHSLMCIKILRRLIISGFDFPNRDETVVNFWNLTLGQIQTFGTITGPASTAVDGTSRQLIGKHLLQLSKFHLDMSDKHPSSFVLLPSSLDLVREYWAHAKRYSDLYTDDMHEDRHDEVEAQSQTNERLCLNSLRLIRACIKMAFKPATTFRFRHDLEKEERKHAEDVLKQELLTQDFVQDLMQIGVGRFLMLRQSDLSDWSSDPEDWVMRQENESEDMNLSIRACSERLVLDICTHFKSTMTKPVLDLFRSVTGDDNADPLLVDAVYAAVGMAGPSFKDEMNFDDLLGSTLPSMVAANRPGSNVLRRRIAIFIGQWVVIKVARESRVTIYDIFAHLLDVGDSDNDLVVRISAGQNLKNVVDDFDFDANQFIPHAELIITRLMALVEEVEQTPTKMALLETMSALIERFDYHIQPFAERIIGMLPRLWEQSGEEHLMKQVILTILSRMVQALKQRSERMHGLLIPIIRNAVQSDSEMQIYLLEEALNLWHSVLVQSGPPISTESLSLVQHLVPFYDRASEALREALEITESYVLLAPEAMLSDTIRKVQIPKLAELIGPKVKAESNGMVCNIVELMLRSAQDLGGEAAVKQVVSELVQAGFLSRLLLGVESAWTAHCTTGPLAKAPAVDGIVETDYFSIFARIILCSPLIFTEAIASINLPHESDQAARDPAKHISWLLEEWFSHFENVGDTAKRKLFCLALTKLLETGSPAVLENLQLLMGMWTDVVTELCEVTNPWPDEHGEWFSIVDTSKDSLVYETLEGIGVPADEDAPEEPEETRRRTLTWHDPVHRISMPSFIKEKLGQAVALSGGEERFRNEWLVNVDGDIVAAFGRTGIM